MCHWGMQLAAMPYKVEHRENFAGRTLMILAVFFRHAQINLHGRYIYAWAGSGHNCVNNPHAKKGKFCSVRTQHSQ